MIQYTKEVIYIMRVYICLKCGNFTIIKDKYTCCPACSNSLTKLSAKDSRAFLNLNGKQRLEWLEDKNGYPISDELNLKRENYISQELDNIKRDKIAKYKMGISTLSQQLSSNIPKCPICQSTNIRKMSGVEKGASIWAFGLYSNKINKTFKCQNCGMTL